MLCVNPTILIQDRTTPHSGPTLAYYPTLNAFGGKFPGLLGPVVQAPKASTPWVAAPAEYNAQCEARNGASWLQLTPGQRQAIRANGSWKRSGRCGGRTWWT